MGKSRLDNLLVERGLAQNLKEAQALILRGVVLSEDQRLSKPGFLVDRSVRLRLKHGKRRYVSRGGNKLEAALSFFSPAVDDSICLDLGASTGGFTDCWLQHGAQKVFAFDVGKGQLDWTLQQDPRVVIRDGYNVRHLNQSHIQEPFTLVSIDLSFISLAKVLPQLQSFPVHRILALVKPQFESRRNEIETGGLISDPNTHKRILERTRSWTTEMGFRFLGELLSPIRGRKGNREVFFYLETRSRQ